MSLTENDGRTQDMLTMHDSRNGPACMSGIRVAVVVPAFNEERLIRMTIKNIPEYVSRIYVVDDGSTDNTATVIQSIQDSRIQYIRHETNKGVGCAIRTGYLAALDESMDVIAVMAGDNQMDPRQLLKVVLPIVRGDADYAKGNRLTDSESVRGMSRWRLFGNIILTMLTKIASGLWTIRDSQNGYTAISARALESINVEGLYPYYGYCNDILVRLGALGFRVLDVPMPAVYGSETSKIKYGRYIVKVGFMLLRRWIWRIEFKLRAHNHGSNVGYRQEGVD